jgi:hypothetical protein
LQIYTDWANHYLAKSGHKRLIKDLQQDVTDGVLLAQIIQVVGKCAFFLESSWVTEEPAQKGRVNWGERNTDVSKKTTFLSHVLVVYLILSLDCGCMGTSLVFLLRSHTEQSHLDCLSGKTAQG